MATAELKPSQAAGRKIDTERAAEMAMIYFQDLFPNQPVSSVALEEVEFSDNEYLWLIASSHHAKAVGSQMPRRAGVLRPRVRVGRLAGKTVVAGGKKIITCDCAAQPRRQPLAAQFG